MVFFFEDRRMLVWDPAAQRQLLRCLLLEPGQAQAWSEAERRIVELDSRMRNLHAALNREEKENQKAQRRVANESTVRTMLTEAESQVRTLTTKRDVLSKQLQEADQLRHRHRLDSLRADEALHAALDQIERTRLTAVEARFPSADESMRYIFSRLMSDAQCLVCGTPDRRSKRDELVSAIDHSACILCRAPLAPTTVGGEDLSDEEISTAKRKVDDAHLASHAARRALDMSTASFNEIARAMSECNRQLTDAEDDVSALVKQLPASEQAVRNKEEGVNSLRARVRDMRAMIKVQREQFAESMSGYREHIRQFADGIKQEFDAAAQGFLLEQSVLTWSVTRSYVGQSGAEGLSPIEFPGFVVEMTGANFNNVVRRDGPEQVSESQREFIDLAFRMALVKVASPDQCSTIMIDAPESSLDAVFVNRAAAVMARFANANASNRLILTSNLAAGKLVPAVLNKAVADPGSRRGRIVDLFVLGEPTRAMQVLNVEYQELRRELFSQLDPSAQASGG
jgi:DNA repair exonuclease SbcCD ATPase subunit